MFLIFLFPSFGYAEKVIVFLGDSLTAGYGLTEEEAYPFLIQEYLKKDGIDWKVINAGISGDTTKGGLERLNWILKSSPAFVFLALGANDGLRGLKTEITQKNLEEIIQTLKKSKINVVLSGMQLPINYGPEYRKAFKNIYPSLAKKHNLPFLPFLLEGVASKTDLNLADGVHPNQKGQEIMAGNIYKFLKPILGERVSWEERSL